jgi:single-stranded DNA-binding protein
MARPGIVSVIVFGDAAGEVAGLEKGRRVYVEGKIEISEWTGNDGAKRSGLKVSSFRAREVSQIGERKAKPSVGNRAPAPSPPNDFYDDPVPF